MYIIHYKPFPKFLCYMCELLVTITLNFASVYLHEFDKVEVKCKLYTVKTVNRRYI